jgi:hypothetical protein
MLRIVNECMLSIHNEVHALAIHEAFQQGMQLHHHVFQSGVLHSITNGKQNQERKTRNNAQKSMHSHYPFHAPQQSSCAQRTLQGAQAATSMTLDSRRAFGIQ